MKGGAMRKERTGRRAEEGRRKGDKRGEEGKG